MKGHALVALREGTAGHRSWGCECGTVGAGYRFTSELDVINEWGAHLADVAARLTPWTCPVELPLPRGRIARCDRSGGHGIGDEHTLVVPAGTLGGWECPVCGDHLPDSVGMCPKRHGQ